MGNCFVSHEEIITSTLSRDRFLFEKVIGKGTFGSVWEAMLKETQHKCAIKEIKKSLITSENAVKVILNEKRVLTKLNHNFIVNLLLAFQDDDYLYLVVELKPAGDLRYHMYMNTQFSEEQCKFFACCMIVALEYIHSRHVIHRDIKPENLLFDPEGFLHITDFGISSFIPKNVCYEASGTPGYMAPEALFKKPHSYCSDFFSIGVVLFESLLGYRPFKEMDRKYIMNQILTQDIYFDGSFSKVPISESCVDFVNSLLAKDPKERLGNKGIFEIKSHPWFMDIDWDRIKDKSVRPPFRPFLYDNFNSFAQVDTIVSRGHKKNARSLGGKIGNYQVLVER